MRPIFLLCLILFTSTSLVKAQSATNYAYLYQEDNQYRPLAQHTISTAKSGQLRLKVRFAVSKPMLFRWNYQNSLADSAQKSMIKQAATDATGWLTLPLDSGSTQNYSWIVLEPVPASDYKIPLWLAPTKKFGGSAISPAQAANAPNSQYLASAEPLKLSSTPTDTIYIFGYQEAFSPATTPMAAPAPGNMAINQRWLTTKPDTLHFTKEGFYFLQTDTSGLAGSGVRVVSPYYPQMRRIRNFAAPIRYLSTQEEWNELQRADFSKEALDRFWFRMTQSQDLAKKIIKYYYRRVASANTLFTGFKEGWKTDQGMFYILYGPPSRVTLLPNGDEEWSYDAQEVIPAISFTFQRILNPFTEPYFQLVRNRNYARTHYQVINQWRRGTDLE